MSINNESLPGLFLLCITSFSGSRKTHYTLIWVLPLLPFGDLSVILHFSPVYERDDRRPSTYVQLTLPMVKIS